MLELLIALFSLLLVSTGLFMTLKGPTVFVLAPDRITEQQRQQIWLFFRNGGALYMLIGFLQEYPALCICRADLLRVYSTLQHPLGRHDERSKPLINKLPKKIACAFIFKESEVK